MPDSEGLIEDAGFNPAVFTWARESAGLSVADAAAALKTRPERLEAIERGEVAPSRSVLLRMSNSYRRSLLAFYLPAPPRKANRGKDFRTVAADRSVDAEAEIDALVKAGKIGACLRGHAHGGRRCPNSAYLPVTWHAKNQKGLAETYLLTLMESGGLGRNRTTDTRIFNPQFGRRLPNCCSCTVLMNMVRSAFQPSPQTW